MATLIMEVPDEVRPQAEAFVDALRHLPPQAIRAYLAELEDDAWCSRVAREAEARLQSGASRLLDWDDVEAELNALPDQD